MGSSKALILLFFVFTDFLLLRSVIFVMFYNFRLWANLICGKTDPPGPVFLCYCLPFSLFTGLGPHTVVVFDWKVSDPYGLYKCGSQFLGLYLEILRTNFNIRLANCSRIILYTSFSSFMSLESNLIYWSLRYSFKKLLMFGNLGIQGIFWYQN